MSDFKSYIVVSIYNVFPTRSDEQYGAFDCGYSPDSSEYDGTLSVGEVDDVSESQSTTTGSSEIPSEEIEEIEEKVPILFVIRGRIWRVGNIYEGEWNI